MSAELPQRREIGADAARRKYFAVGEVRASKNGRRRVARDRAPRIGRACDRSTKLTYIRNVEARRAISGSWRNLIHIQSQAFFWVRLSRPRAWANRRRRRILADDIHRFILVCNLGQALRTAMVPTRLSSGVLANSPAQGFRVRPRLARVVANVFDLGPARTTSQDDFWTIADQHIKKAYRNFTGTATNNGPASPRGGRHPWPWLCWNRAGRRHYLDALADQHRALLRGCLSRAPVFPREFGYLGLLKYF
jgi:hypothetical protein